MPEDQIPCGALESFKLDEPGGGEVLTDHRVHRGRQVD